MFTSSADVFRIRQSLGDLRAYLRESGPSVRDRLAASMKGRPSLKDARAHIDRVVDGQGGRFSNGDDADVEEVCRLAAALPSDDYPAFTFATAVLLADRLQTGGNGDDLYWNWDAFHEEYALADPPVRAAIMSAFRIGDETDRLSIGDQPLADLCLTRSRAEVLAQLERSGDLEMISFVAREPTPSDAGVRWTETSEDALSEGADIAFRYLYERPQSMAPGRASDARLIPWRL